MRATTSTTLALAAALLGAACADPTAGRTPAADDAGIVQGPRFNAAPTPVPSPEPVTQFIVAFKAGKSELANPSAAAAAGIHKRGRLVYSNAAVYDGVTDPAVLAADANVASVAENFLSYPTQTGYPTRALFWLRNWQWNMRQIRADSTPSTVRGANTRVCIIDSGVDKTHQDLAGKVVAEASFVDPAHGYPGPGLSAAHADSNGHGTHVASTVTSNGVGVAGVAPAARIMTAKVFAATGGASLAAIFDAIDWCRLNQADVINMSLGGRRPRPLTVAQVDDSTLYAARIQAAREAGVVVVVAAGNENLRLDATVPTLAYTWPAQIPGAVTVGASAPTAVKPAPATGGYYDFPFNPQAPHAGFDGRASYSNYGADVDIWAPGGTGFINRVQANITAACSSFSGGCTGGRSYMSIQGTSMASPHVAGLAALVTSRTTAPRSLARVEAIEGCMLATGDQVSFAGSGQTNVRPRINAKRAATESCPGI